MLIRSPSLVELHAFLAVARSGNFRRAAEDLCVTQAAVSRAVQRLEEELGQTVFVRAPGGVTLTPAGERLRNLVERPVAALEAAATELRQQPERQKLRLSVITSLGSMWLMPRLEDFHRAHPEVEIEFRQYHHDEDFTRDDVDLWIENKRTAQEPWPRQIAATYLIGREIVAVCAPRLAQGVRSAQQLAQLPFLYHSNYPDNWELWARAQGIELPPNRRGSGFDLVLNLIEAARAGMGVAVVQQCMVEGEIASARLAMPVPGTADTQRGYFICRRRALGAHPAADLFSDWLARQVAASEPASPAARRATG